METTVPPPTKTELPANVYVSDIGRIVFFWNPGIDLAAALQGRHEQRLRADKKRKLIESILPDLEDCYPLCLIDPNECLFGGSWDNLDEVPDWILMYIDGAWFEPETGFLVLETCSPIID